MNCDVWKRVLLSKLRVCLSEFLVPGRMRAAVECSHALLRVVVMTDFACPFQPANELLSS